MKSLEDPVGRGKDTVVRFVRLSLFVSLVVTLAFAGSSLPGSQLATPPIR